MFTQTSQRAGHVVTQQSGGEGFSAFIPKQLPPAPPVQFDDEIQLLLAQANRFLGKLDGATYLLPDKNLFLYMFTRKEAVLSSQIEGTQASLTDLLQFEQTNIVRAKQHDIQEVSNYVKAMNYGLQRLSTLPISTRLVKELHGILLNNTRGGEKAAGEFRRSQNWIGGSRPSNAVYVPPPPHEIPAAMSNLEKFIHDDSLSITPLLKAGIVHAQFETIHPFLDGNGRLGRLLITLILYRYQVLDEPLLYLSLYFKRHRQTYYEKLNSIRKDGDWEGWLKFYLQGIAEISQQAIEAARKIIDLQNRDRERLRARSRSAVLFRLLDVLCKNPVLNVATAADILAVTLPTARTAIKSLEETGILQETTGRKRDRSYSYQEYLEIIKEGTDLD